MNKKPAQKKQTQPQQSKEQEQEMLMFQQYLMQKYQVDETQIESVLQNLGEEGIKKEYIEFKQFLDQQKQQSFRLGGMLQKIVRLKSLKQ